MWPKHILTCLIHHLTHPTWYVINNNYQHIVLNPPGSNGIIWFNQLPIPTVPYCLHLDGGTNRSVTNNCDLLSKVVNIQKILMPGVAEDQLQPSTAWLKATFPGRLIMETPSWFYATAANKPERPSSYPLISSSPTYFTIQCLGPTCWLQQQHTEYLQFMRRTGTEHTIFLLVMNNGLW